MKKYMAILFAAFIGLSCFAGSSAYNTTQRDEAIRLILTPGHLAAQLDETNSPIVTAYTIANVPTNLQGVAQITLMASQDFTFDEGNSRFYYSRPGATNVPFNVKASLSFSQNASAAEVIVRATINGVAAPGVYFRRTVGNNNVVGVGYLAGHFTLSENDYVEISFESDKTGTVNSWGFSTEIVEEAQ
jgi:hypothetical protein